MPTYVRSNNSKHLTRTRFCHSGPHSQSIPHPQALGIVFLRFCHFTACNGCRGFEKDQGTENSGAVCPWFSRTFHWSWGCRLSVVLPLPTPNNRKCRGVSQVSVPKNCLEQIPVARTSCAFYCGKRSYTSHAPGYSGQVSWDSYSTYRRSSCFCATPLAPFKNGITLTDTPWENQPGSTSVFCP